MPAFLNTVEFFEFCHKVFEHLPIPIDFLDRDGRLIYINKAFIDFLQVPEDQVLGRLVTDVNSTSRFLEVLKSKKAEIAWGHKFPNGREALVHRIPILEDNGDLMGGFGVILFEDIDKMKEVMEKNRVLDRELKLYKNEIARMNSTKYNLGDILGRSPVMIKCKEKVKKVARFNSNVLITGESGVGKELFAHAIHMESDRGDMPFDRLNCSAIPKNLLESELFGYEDGAFTGAKKGGSIGKFELANGGTIFLDEIGDMPYHMQVKILRVLQEKEVERIGGKNPIKLNVRVICATNKDLQEMVKEGKFREDLYYRLNVLTIEVPSLKNRKEDIPILVERFLGEFYKESGLYRNMPGNVMNIMMDYNWPGNVRELKNVIEKMCVNSDDVTISINDLPPYIINDSIKDRYEDKAAGLNKILESVEKEIIMNTLKECGNNKSEAAKKLNIPRARLYRKIEEFGIEL
jgi:transcriptional regulator with PAS, ATPase and Fis domain